MKKQLNPTLVYVLSIIGLLCCWIGGAVLSIPAYFMAANKIKAAELNPEEYEGDLKAMKTAKLVAMISAIIGVLVLARTIYALATMDMEEFSRAWEEAMQKQGQ